MDSTTKEKALNLEDLQSGAKQILNKTFGNVGTCSTAAATTAKAVTLGTTFELVTGATILVTFTNGISVANATLAVTHTPIGGSQTTETAKPIYYRGAALPANIVKANDRLILRYNGTQFDVVGALGLAESEVDEKISAAVNVEKTRAEGVEEALDGRIDTLEDAVGTGGSIDQRIEDATEDCAYLGEDDGSETIADFDPQADSLWKGAQVLSSAEKAQVKTNLGLPQEIYSKTEVNNLITTPNQQYVTVATYASLPASGSADTIYRVSNYNGSTSQVDSTMYSEYAWNGTDYQFLCVKSQVGEVFDISAYNSNTKYADLAAALGTNGANVPEGLRKGGMSVKFVSNSDNKYVQSRYMSSSTATADFTNVDNWQGVDTSPKLDSNNIPDSNGTFRMVRDATTFNIDKASVAGSWGNNNNRGRATFELDASGHNGIWSLLNTPVQKSAVRMDLSSLENNKVYNISFDVSYTGDTTLARLNVTESSTSGKIEIVDYYSGKEVYIKNGHVEINIQKTSSWNYLYIFYGSIDTLTYPLDVTISNFALYELKDVKARITEIDEIPTEGSENFVKSGGVFDLLLSKVEGTLGFDYYQKAIDLDGELVPGALVGGYVREYNIIPGHRYMIKGYGPTNTQRLFYAFYDSDKNFISGGTNTAGNNAKMTFADIPISAAYIRIQGSSVSDALLYSIGSVPELYFSSDKRMVVPDIINIGKCISADGTLADATSSGAICNEFIVEGSKRYYVSGYSPSDNNSNNFVSIVAKDANDTVLLHYKPCKNAGFQNFVLDTPLTCTRLFVFGTSVQHPIVQKYPLTLDNIAINSIPMLYNSIEYRPLNNNTIKILCLGSSWFMDTWWYLNKILGETGVNSELHCYYMGHAKMREWVALYNNNLTPFTEEPSRNASKNISTNGSDWVKSNYSASGSYNAQAYRDDFYTDLISGNWDIIAIQQGAQEAIVHSEWEAGLELVELVKRYCHPRTTIALNATWTHGLGYSGSYFNQISRLADGKYYFQQLNNRNTKWFMARTGISNISPNGAMMSLMRADDTLNISNDMATDGLHPDNGLPILGLAGCFYETFIAPLVGISFIELNWLPTSSTQKAPVSGSSFQKCNTEQLATIKRYVKKALSNRFIFYT